MMQTFNYDSIKALAKAQGCKVTDLIALAPQNDPFYTGTPNDHALGAWFADLWLRFGYAAGVHLRRVHYQIISQDPPVHMPNGLPYENTEACWDTLGMASKAARYLGLVDPGAFVDRRNPEAAVYTQPRPDAPSIEITGDLWGDETELPDFPDLPDYQLRDFTGAQPYHLEIWCEKSTMNDVLEPLARRYAAVLQVGVGELSITATLAMVNRLHTNGKPARIFYVSDFDPAGQSMPVAVSRKAEYFIRSLDADLDVRLFPVVLTAAQVRHYRLPRTPIKETELRRDSFEQRHGTGAVELDALEALHPGALRRMLVADIERYYDLTLEARVFAAQRTLLRDLESLRQAIIDRHDAQIDALRAAYAQLQAEFSARMEGYTQRLTAEWQAIREELAQAAPDIEAYPVPEGGTAAELADGLLNSRRDYLQQIQTYKAHQGRTTSDDACQ